MAVQTPAGSSSPCYYHWSHTGISNDGKIQGGSLEGSLLRYFLQMLSQNETVVSQYSVVCFSSTPILKSEEL